LQKSCDLKSWIQSSTELYPLGLHDHKLREEKGKWVNLSLHLHHTSVQKVQELR
jgi:hypothetical protein